MENNVNPLSFLDVEITENTSQELKHTSILESSNISFHKLKFPFYLLLFYVVVVASRLTNQKSYKMIKMVATTDGT